MKPTPDMLGFLTFALLIIMSGIFMIIAERVVHSAVFLLIAMLATAGIFTLLEAEFLAAMQVMVYAGAVMVLMLFTIMLTVTQPEEGRNRVRELSLTAGLIALVFLGVVYSVLGSAERPLPVGQPDAPLSTVAHLGELLFRNWVLPFELASIVLLIALVGAIRMAMSREGL